MATHHSVTIDGKWTVSVSGTKDTGKIFCETSHIISGKLLFTFIECKRYLQLTFH
jgi:hypothetical protein